MGINYHCRTVQSCVEGASGAQRFALLNLALEVTRSPLHTPYFRRLPEDYPKFLSVVYEHLVQVVTAYRTPKSMNTLLASGQISGEGHGVTHPAYTAQIGAGVSAHSRADAQFIQQGKAARR